MVPGINEVACSLIQEVSRLLETEEGLPETGGGGEGIIETGEGLPETRESGGEGAPKREERGSKRLLERGE